MSLTLDVPHGLAEALLRTSYEIFRAQCKMKMQDSPDTPHSKVTENLKMAIIEH